MLLDLLSLLLGCIAIFWAKEPALFGITVLTGAILAAFCWYVCSVYTHYWNRKFRVTLTHHILCGFASICTLVFVVLFVSLYYTKDAALASIAVWQLQLNQDNEWAEQTFATAYDRVKELGIEDFSNAPPPGSPNSLIPTTQDESRQTAASVYADEACNHFDTSRPFLSKIVWSSPGVPSETIFKDTVEWFQTNNTYPPSRAIDIAATQIKEGLDPQVPRVLHLSRAAVAILFVLAQAIPFGLIGWAAYTDIKVRV
jgi:hypothetical protein